MTHYIELFFNLLGQGQVSAALANLGAMSRLLADANNPCAGISCGDFGSCFQGVCRCRPGTGYTGSRCEIEPVRLPYTLTEWSEWSVCSATCGGGSTTRSRRCFPQPFGVPCPAATLNNTAGPFAALLHPTLCHRAALLDTSMSSLVGTLWPELAPHVILFIVESRSIASCLVAVIH